MNAMASAELMSLPAVLDQPIELRVIHPDDSEITDEPDLIDDEGFVKNGKRVAVRIIMQGLSATIHHLASDHGTDDWREEGRKPETLTADTTEQLQEYIDEHIARISAMINWQTSQVSLPRQRNND